MAHELSIMADESGGQGGHSKYYLLTLVFHDQGEDILGAVGSYEHSLAASGLPDIPFHAGPLMRGHEEYAGLSMAQRRRLHAMFAGLVRRLPIRYTTFAYRRNELGTPEQHAARMRKDVSAFLFGHLGYFQHFDRVKVFYDDGQRVVHDALHASVEFALAREAALFRRGSYEQYRLLQAADFLCAVELAAVKYAAREQTSTDEAFFGGSQSFRRNWLKQARQLRVI